MKSLFFVALLLTFCAYALARPCTQLEILGQVQLTGACLQFTCQGGGPPTSICNNPTNYYKISYFVNSQCDLVIPIGNTTFGQNFFTGLNSPSQGQASYWPALTTGQFVVQTDPNATWSWNLCAGQPQGPYGVSCQFLTSTQAAVSCTI